MMTKAITNSELSLRKEPRASTKILDIIPVGTSVTVLDSTELQQKKWSQIDVGDNVGWVPTSSLDFGTKSAKPKLDTSEVDVEAKTEELIENIQAQSEQPVADVHINSTITETQESVEETTTYKSKKKK